MVHRIEKYIVKNMLLSPGSKVLVALSGGADSVALLVVLMKLGYRCEAMHCNFHLRGEESNRDERFVAELCARHNIPLHTVHFDTAAYAKKQGISIEMAARELRYAAFEERRAKIGAEAIAVAHHRDDSAETLLLNLLRGTGIKGLCGIQPKNGYIVRPLLCVGRADIIDYLKWRNETFVTDSTNLTNDYTRNKIRLDIIPRLAEINPSVLESLAATANRLREAEQIYNKAIKDAISRIMSGNTIDISALKKETAPQTLLHEILSPLGFNSTQVTNISETIESEGCREVTNREWRIIKERDTLLIVPNEEQKEYTLSLPAEGCIDTGRGTLIIERLSFDGNIPKESNRAMLDTSKLKKPLTLRSVRKGDRFAPFGMRGTKLVSDYLTDRKKSIIDKRQQLVVTDATGAIVWLVGERPAAPYCVKNSTKEVIALEWKSKEA